MTNVNICFTSGSIINLILIDSKSVRTQIMNHLRVYHPKKHRADIIFMVDGRVISSSDTVKSLKLIDNDHLDAFYKKKPHPELVNHIKEEGFDISKFMFLDENMAVARI